VASKSVAILIGSDADVRTFIASIAWAVVAT
jgi:hypothetical protein